MLGVAQPLDMRKTNTGAGAARGKTEEGKHYV